ncbi:rhomboid family intramembrane serine protease [Paracoccus sp. 1_MG-2023]|uniref:rhomboid family intramembrane serine protease n=1 Tax=unclassified Paracoccus (in: a-proteobacteria) TaxID=2688777 RepID=UPI001C096512|nr:MULTISPECIES: rhomboid family intramembrane serine protease [unclassified Paracoccus (in: a-proteobacteria)]MBU2957363.1 rhomboid family intramembrane serine protease [Paracoccus sp. C2R09]MDO6670125.1 rhomboid family intramembrane serine protease [Paracoccus sp. 1_MG-2023]
MTDVPRVSAPRLAPPHLPGWTKAVILVCCAVELLLMAAPVLGFAQGRVTSSLLGGFWSPLMWGATGIYPAQGVAMFVTYGFLHAGLLHLAMNMISLAAIARELNRMIGARAMALSYVLSQIAGGVAFAAMLPTGGPMIGASGAVFGLAGTLVGYAAINLRLRGRSMTPLLRSVGMILALNIGLTLLMPQIAWEAHLGGALMGTVIGAALAFRRR